MDDLDTRFKAYTDAAKQPPSSGGDLESRFADYAKKQSTPRAPYQTGAAARQAAKSTPPPPSTSQKIGEFLATPIDKQKSSSRVLGINIPTGKIAKGALETARALAGLPSEEVSKGVVKDIARSAWDATEYAGPVGMAAHAIADRTRASKKIEQATESSNTEQTIGKVFSELAQLAIPAPGSVEVRPIIKNRLPPKMASAVGELERQGVDLTLGQKTGNKAIMGGEKMAQWVPGSSGRALEASEKQGEQAVTAMQRYAKSVPSTIQKTAPSGRISTLPDQQDAIGAGAKVGKRVLDERIPDIKKYANRQYESIKSQLNRYASEVQPKKYDEAVGKWKQEYSKWAEKNEANWFDNVKGTPAPPAKPLRPKSAVQVDLEAARKQLSPMFAELTRAMPQTEKESSPGYAALKTIMGGEEKFGDGMVIDKDLSAIKSMLRGDSKKYLATTSGRYAYNTISALEKQLEKGLSDVNPKLVTQLYKARKATEEAHLTEEFISKLIPKPAKGMATDTKKVYDALTKAGGNQLPQVLKLKQIAPRAMDTVAQTYLNGMVEKVEEQGGFSKQQTVLNSWNRMDNRVKDAMFGPELRQSLDRFLLGATELSLGDNPSGSAKWLVLRRTYGEVATAATAILGTLLFGAEPKIAAEAAGGLTTVVGGAKLASKLMFDKKYIDMMTKAITLPIGGPAQVKAMIGLEKGIKELQSEEDTKTPPKAETNTKTPPGGPNANK